MLVFLNERKKVFDGFNFGTRLVGVAVARQMTAGVV
jgi:hypothetical protein